MKLGAENKKQVIVMLVLLGIAIPLLVYEFRDQLFGAAYAGPALPTPTPTPLKNTGVIPHDNSDPRLRLDVLEASRKVKYDPGRNIFRMEEAPIQKTITEVRPKLYTVTEPPTPTPTPPPPPIPIVYYGYASKPGEPKRIFLQKQGDDNAVFIAAQGDIVARRYKIVEIHPNSVTMEDVLTSNRQPIPLTVK